MLYISRSAQGGRTSTGRTWLAVGYGLAAALMVALAVAACIPPGG